MRIKHSCAPKSTNIPLMIVMKDYALPPLCLRMNSSRSMGTARSQSSVQEMVLNWDLVRCLAAEYFFIQKALIYASRICELSFYAPLRSTCEILLHRRIRWARRCGSDEDSQSSRFPRHQYVLISSSLGVSIFNRVDQYFFLM